MAKQFEKGDRVNTPMGPGTVVYKRLEAVYNVASAYSVCLDSKKAKSELPPFPSYTGTIFPAEQVTEE